MSPVIGNANRIIQDGLRQMERLGQRDKLTEYQTALKEIRTWLNKLYEK